MYTYRSQATNTKDVLQYSIIVMTYFRYLRKSLENAYYFITDYTGPTTPAVS